MNKLHIIISTCLQSKAKSINTGAWVWKSVLESDDCEQIRIKCDKLSFKSIAKYDLCLTGDVSFIFIKSSLTRNKYTII